MKTSEDIQIYDVVTNDQKVEVIYAEYQGEVQFLLTTDDYTYSVTIEEDLAKEFALAVLAGKKYRAPDLYQTEHGDHIDYDPDYYQDENEVIELFSVGVGGGGSNIELNREVMILVAQWMLMGRKLAGLSANEKV